MSSGTNALGNNGGRSYSFLVKPVVIDCNWVVDSTNGNGLGIRSLKGAGVRNVYMHTAETPAAGNPNPAVGFALVQLQNNYNRFIGLSGGGVSPVTGGTVAINGTALTIGNPYVIVSVGHAAAGAATIAPVADSSGSLASTWMRIYDGYGNTFIVWYYVTGVGGSAPIGVSGTLVQQTIAENATADNITTALAATLALLPSGIAGVYSFTTSGGGTATLTLTSTQVNPYGPLPGAPADGAIPTGATFVSTVYNSNLKDWQAVGVPAGVVPAVGVSFIATATGKSVGGGSTGLVEAVGLAAIDVEPVGDANQSIGPKPMGGSPNIGGWILVQFSQAGIAVTPADGQVLGLSISLEAGSPIIQGE